MAARITRAKKALREAQVEFEMPVGEAEFHRAAAMTANERERDHLLARAAELG